MKMEWWEGHHQSLKKPVSQREQQTCRIIFTQYDRGKVSSFYNTETQLAH